MNGFTYLCIYYLFSAAALFISSRIMKIPATFVFILLTPIFAPIVLIILWIFGSSALSKLRFISNIDHNLLLFNSQVATIIIYVIFVLGMNAIMIPYMKSYYTEDKTKAPVAESQVASSPEEK